ncbi:TPA: 2,3,4,5-tetrahydropyridine-2,6-carboxylate N-succinyltransferase [Neisseria meningitidis]|nr:2,3,4,5-tetrahydropyridine-2,6-carboxylate N-succinyltransferase [Neisseria meningitidis]
MTTHIRTCVYHDSSTKGFKHGIKHKRHDCWRGEINVFQRGEDGKKTPSYWNTNAVTQWQSVLPGN